MSTRHSQGYTIKQLTPCSDSRDTTLPLTDFKKTSKTVEFDSKQDIKQDVGQGNHNCKKAYIKITNLKCHPS